MADLDRDETLKEEVDQEEKAAGSGDTETAEETDASGDTESTEDDADPDAGEENGEASEDAPEGKKKSRLFSKKEKKKDKKDQQIEELTDRLMRQMAELIISASVQKEKRHRCLTAAQAILLKRFFRSLTIWSAALLL